MRRPFAAVFPATQSSRELRNALTAGLVVGIAAAALWAIPATRTMEQEVGLRWLFKLRGAVDPPDDVVLVLMSGQSARNIFLPNDPEKFHRCVDLRVGSGSDAHESLPALPARWPRCIHARLIKKLSHAGARTIAFDVLFHRRPPLPGPRGDLNAEQDAELAAAMTAAGNVVVARKLLAGGTETGSTPEQLLPISAVIEHAALGSAPFTVLPSASRRIDRYAVFTDDGWGTPSLPMLVLQAQVLGTHPAFRALIARVSREDADLLPADGEALRKQGGLQATGTLLRQFFRHDPDLQGRLRDAITSSTVQPADAEMMRVLLSAYGGESSRMLNFYGPAGSIPSVAIDHVLAIPEPPTDPEHRMFDGKAVFVGYAETSQAEQVEHFSSVYSGSAGVDLSGVEIAATAFANLLHDSSIHPAPDWLAALITLLLGTGITILCLLQPNRVAIPATVTLLLAYGGFAVYAFSVARLWLPVVLPMLVGAPTAIVYAIVRRYLDARAQRDRVREAFRQFVPPGVAEELERNAGRIVSTRKSLDCICVATDAARFTTLAETMASDAITDFLNDYFDALFKPVIEHGGFVSDVVGDAMLAIWPDRSSETRRLVCNALLEMRDAAEDFNRRVAHSRMTTRFGANWGHVTLATVGSRAHYEYRAVGDPVNTTSRIQELNKKLGTQILVSQALLDQQEGFLCRDLGLFQLRGKSTPEHISELIDRQERATPEQLELLKDFAQALQMLESATAGSALAAFRQVLDKHPGDGPTRFYAEYLSTRTLLRTEAVVVE